MNEDEKKQMVEAVATHRAQWETPEYKHLVDRVFAGTATVDDLLTFSIDELKNCMESLPPEAPDNGQHVDPFHSGCCALRAMVSMIEARRLLKDQKY